MPVIPDNARSLTLARYSRTAQVQNRMPVGERMCHGDEVILTTDPADHAIVIEAIADRRTA